MLNDHGDFLALLKNAESKPHGEQLPKTRHTKKSVTPKIRHFIRSIDLEWAVQASRCFPKKQATKVHGVTLALWWRAGLEKKMSPKLRHRHFEKFGVSNASATRILRVLENNGLVSVKKGRGKIPVVTILLPEETLQD